MGKFKDLMAYKQAFELALEMHNMTKRFPIEKSYSLTDQIRRSSRSACVTMKEGSRKRRYKAHFIAKMTDADMENSETQVWLDFSFAFGYINEQEHLDLYRKAEEVVRMINHIIENPEKYGAT